MNANPEPGWKPKHAWLKLERVEPSKRTAAERVSDFFQTDDLYDEPTASEQASRCIQCPHPRCVECCPLDVPVPELMGLVADCRFEEAVKLLLATHSLPEVFAHICSAKSHCEAACVLTAKADPVPISCITRFLLAYGNEHGITESAPKPATGQRVAVIGSGICGLVGADALSRQGHAVTVLDCHQKPGGRVMNGLPGFRVNPKLIERRVELLRQRGVQFRMGVICGQDVTFGRLRKDFDAVFFGLGRAEAVALEVPGAKLRGVDQAYSFVLGNTSTVKLDHPPMEVRGKRVVVLGGGDTAMDALRVAIRHGASEAVCLYRRDRAGLPANPEDFANAEEEGARFQFQVQPVAILGNAAGEVTSVRCVQTEPGEPDALGKPGVQAVAGSEFDVPADVVLVAYGFAPPKLPCNGEFLELSRTSRGCLVVDENQMTNIPGVFAGGSIVRGPAPLTDVVRDARKAAAAIDRYLANYRKQ